VEQVKEIQPEAGESERGRRGILWWLTWMAVGMVVYVLSIGPAQKLSRAGIIPNEAVEFLYSPVSFIGDQFGGFDHFLRWYVYDLWGAYPPGIP
jgi:hypothetical protein